MTQSSLNPDILTLIYTNLSYLGVPQTHIPLKFTFSCFVMQRRKVMMYKYHVTLLKYKFGHLYLRKYFSADFSLLK